MRWGWVVMALVVGGLAAGWWFLQQRRQENRAQEVPQQGQGEIALMVQHDGPMLELQWNIRDSDVENAGGATLTITDGSHESKLDLDQAELRSGKADYWPQGDHVTFKLETDGGAWGSLQAPAWEVQPQQAANEPPAETDQGDRPKRHPVTEAAARKSRHGADRSKDAPSAKSVRSKQTKHKPAKIPSAWKVP